MAGSSLHHSKTSRFAVKKLYERFYHEVVSNMEDGNTEVALKLIRSKLSEINHPNEHGTTLLMSACQLNKLSVVTCLITENANINSHDVDGWTSLMYACKDGRIEIVCELIEAGANIELRDVGGWTALMWASYKGQADCVEELVKHGANTNVRAIHNMTCLHWAAGRGHVKVVDLLLEHGAKVNATDKYGSTPLIWAARKGYLPVVKKLLHANASVDVVGMYSWTPLLVAIHGGCLEVANEILSCSPNVNSTDKSGMTALAIAAKDGYIDLVTDLLNLDAYVNVADKNRDTVLHHAVKGGHTEIVKKILRRSPDIDAAGCDRKTPLYLAVEKANVDVTKLILGKEPDKELADKDGNTPLLRAVRSKNYELTYLLLEKGSKVSTVDSKGDTALHIAIRTRNRRMLELLLRNPKNSRILYMRNKAGETPYSIDSGHRRSLLSYIFGAKSLNSQDAVESQLGYELYSSALADILSSPHLNTPMTVGLFAKWGSGKSFMLNKLKDDMKVYMRQSPAIHFEFSWLVFILIFTLSALVGLILAGSVYWIAGLCTGCVLFFVMYALLCVLYGLDRWKTWDWVTAMSYSLAKKLQKLRLLMYMFFYNRPRSSTTDDLAHHSIRFVFAESTKLTSLGGEKSLASMIGSLCDVLESQYGTLLTRLYKVFGSHKENRGKFKKVCCVPYFVVVIAVLLCLVIAIGLIWYFKDPNTTDLAINIVMLILAGIVALTFLVNLHNVGRAVAAYVSSPKQRTIKACQNIDSDKSDKFIHILKEEVNLISSMVTCMDRFEGWQTRLVLIIDGLDSCEQEKVLQVLDTINLVIPDNSPFITLLALDPHILINGIERNLLQGLQDSNLNGYSYLRNLVHLPFYLQNHGLPRMHVASEKAQLKKWHNSAKEAKNKSFMDRQPSVFSSVASLAGPAHPSAGRRSSLGFDNSVPAMEPLHQYVGDMPKNLVKNDYFVDVNPRSMRRLMNIIAVSGRLLRANDIEFNWYRLSAWINITEQWPYKTSWILLYYEEMGGKLDESMSLLAIYDRVKSRMPASRDVEPLLDVDRNEKKFTAFLRSHMPKLNVEDIKKFMKATINLDPYMRKLIKEKLRDQEHYPGVSSSPVDHGKSTHPKYQLMPNVQMQGWMNSNLFQQPMPVLPHQTLVQPVSRAKIPQGTKCLSKLLVSDVCDLISKIKGVSTANLDRYKISFMDNNINGQVLAECDLQELRVVLEMTFGDWQLFKSTVLAMREVDNPSPSESLLSQHASVAAEIGNYVNAGTGGMVELDNDSSPTSSCTNSPTLSRTSVTGLSPIRLPAQGGMRQNDTVLDTVLLENQMIETAMHNLVPDLDEDATSSSDEEQETVIKLAKSANPSPREAGVQFSISNETEIVIQNKGSDLQPLVNADEIELSEVRVKRNGDTVVHQQSETVRRLSSISSTMSLPKILEEGGVNNPSYDSS